MDDLYPLFAYEKYYLPDLKIEKIFIAQLTFKDKYLWTFFNPLAEIYEFIFIHKTVDNF